MLGKFYERNKESSKNIWQTRKSCNTKENAIKGIVIDLEKMQD